MKIENRTEGPLIANILIPGARVPERMTLGKGVNTVKDELWEVAKKRKFFASRLDKRLLVEVVEPEKQVTPTAYVAEPEKQAAEPEKQVKSPKTAKAGKGY